ncbi:MAG: electron transfer flavoprotein-ubiquinone oxidoreductase [Pseudomonadota bacterium]|nr:electron transfer flavoprotein-ubiquinone oxidoreductase [Pseudomonadota bacterium]
MNKIIRESMEYDVVIVGAGPAGLSAAIRLKQLDSNISVVVLEKGSEVGAHILSGAVLDPSGLDRLIPDWRAEGAPIKTKVTEDRFLLLGPAGGVRIPSFPMPPLMRNEGNYIVSMGKVCRWLANRAEALGVEVFPGMACSDLVYDNSSKRLKGVVAGEFGLDKEGKPGPNYEPGMELHGKYVFLAEGVRGSLSKKLIKTFSLDLDCDYQKFGLGMKEVWEIKPENHFEGRVIHTMGWPLGNKAGGGSFVYHAENNLLYIGFVVHLNYRNPYLFPYEEFQRFKHHPMLANILEGGKRISYGARAISEGGLQSIPRLTVPGGVLLGCSAGLVNVPRIKGNHNAMISGLEAAEAAHRALNAGRSQDDLFEYEDKVRSGYIAKDLKKVKNVKPMWSRFGLTASLILGGLDMWFATITGWNLFGTLKHGKSDADSTETAAKHNKMEYKKPDNILSFDRLTSVSFSGTNHADDQPCHLTLKDKAVPIKRNLPIYDEPAQRYCPAGVYEFIRDNSGKHVFQINSQNCVHCKTCDIKDPSQNIEWVTPNGGDGPNYSNM